LLGEHKGGEGQRGSLEEELDRLVVCEPLNRWQASGFMKFATRHGVKRPAVMRLTMKLLGNLTETRGGDAVDRLINAVSKMTPAA